MKLARLTAFATAIFLGASAGAFAQSQQPSAGASASEGRVASASADYSKSMDKLLQAAQRLRESIQQMAQMKAGPERDRAIQEAKEALFETQRAMVELPPELRQSDKSAGMAKYEDSLQELMKAADRLRESIQTMAQQQAGPGRNQAIEQANRALFDTQQAMIALPYPAGSSAAGGTSR